MQESAGIRRNYLAERMQHLPLHGRLGRHKGWMDSDGKLDDIEG